MLRSVLSIVAGIVVLTATSFAIELALNPLLLRLFPHALPDPQALSSNPWVKTLTFAYGTMCVAAGGYVTAWIGRRSPMTHAAALGIIQAGLTIMAMLSPVGSHASQFQWVATAVLSIPAALVGGILYKRGKRDEQLEKAPASA
jgi:MFS family permease